MESYFFTNINVFIGGLIVAILFLIVAFQIKNRMATKFLHYLKQKLLSFRKRSQ